MKVLAIDQASTAGWCIEPNNLSGTWDFKTRKDESSGMKNIRFKSKLNEVCKAEGVELIVYERIAGMHKSSIIHAAKMVAMIETYCEENGIAYKAYSASEIKKFATGKGNANKEKMVEACIKNYGIEPIDDNHADAIHLWYLAISEL